MPSGAVLKTLLLADLVDSTGLVRRLGDAGAAELFARHDRQARDLLSSCGGREIDKADGFLLLFDRPFDAVRFATLYHASLDRLARETSAPLAARIGIHVGEVYLRENAPADVARGAKPLEVEGLAKPMVARLVSLAGGRQTLLSRTAFDLARRAAVGERLSEGEVRWLAHGAYRFQGLDEPVEIFEVGVVGRSLLSAPADSAKARRAVAAGDEITLGWRPAADLEVPHRPHWVLVQRVGEGGFGEVWLGRHAKTGETRVFKFCYQAEQLRALRREVAVFRLLKEVLGSRDDIARILDWNFEQAPYFLESEYTEGGNLRDWAEQQGGLDRVPLATRLELIAQVAEALAAAHSVGVLHKDVKPDNVLITHDRDGTPRARLTDFGIGLITDGRLLAARGITSFGLTEVASDFQESMTAGTRLYMAPELLEGRVPTVQADVYALGVMLYQTVVGNFSQALAPGWRRQIEDDLLRDDIAGFVDGEPSRRPASALEVAERLRSLGERRERRDAERRAREDAERAHRRRRVAAIAAAVASLFLVVVSVLALQAVQARREAEQRREQAEELVSFMVGDLWEKLDPVARREILGDIPDKVLAYFDSLPRERLSESELFRRATALTQVGQVRIDEGNLAAALESFTEALEISRELASAPEPDPEWVLGLGTAHHWMSVALREQGHRDRAFEHARAYLGAAARLQHAEPDNPEWQLELAYGHHNVGMFLKERGDLAEALEELQAALDIKQRLAPERPDDLKLKASLGVSHNSVGSVLQLMGELDRALAHYQAEMAVKQELVSKEPDNTHWRQTLALSHNFVGRLFEALGEQERALEELESAVEILERLVSGDPDHRSWKSDLAINQLRVGAIVASMGRHDEGLAIVRRAAGEVSDLAARDPTNQYWQDYVALAGYRMAQVRAERGEADAALAEAEAALAILEELLAERGGELSLMTLSGRCQILRGRLFAAKGLRDRAVAAWEQAAARLAPVVPESADFQILAPQATALLLLGRRQEAAPLVEKLLDMGYREKSFLDLCRRAEML